MVRIFVVHIQVSIHRFESLGMISSDMDNIGWREDYGKMGSEPWLARD